MIRNNKQTARAFQQGRVDGMKMGAHALHETMKFVATGAAFGNVGITARDITMVSAVLDGLVGAFDQIIDELETETR